MEIHEKVEEIKDIVKEISLRTKENLGGEVTENVEDMKNLIRDLEKETLMLKVGDLKDEAALEADFLNIFQLAPMRDLTPGSVHA